MSKTDDAKQILASLGVSERQQNMVCCCTLLALAKITEEEQWKKATNEWIRIHDVIEFSNNNYGKDYAENTRENFRKTAMHHFRNAAFIEDNGEPTNSPNYRYRLTDEMLKLIRSFGTAGWEKKRRLFIKKHASLIELYASRRSLNKIPVKINDVDLRFSPGKHNQLQKAVIEQFAPRFSPNSECLYIGDTIKKDIINNENKLRELGFKINLHDKMPDVVLYDEEKHRLFFIEAVTSVGPMEPKSMQINLSNFITENQRVKKW